MKKIAYHTFTDNKDEYFKTLKEAKAQIKVWKNNGEENLRIHKLTELNPEEPDLEELIYAKGDFPY